MSFTLSLLALISSAGALAVVHLLRSTPEGYEDEKGFHFTEPEANAPRPSPVLIPVKSAHRPAHF